MIDALTDELTEFIQAQPVFFVATAAPGGRVNVSPKGMDSLRVLAPDRVVWLNLTGSGNETAAHIAASERMTLMSVEAIRADRELEPFYATMTSAELNDYWARRNSTSIDGYPTQIFAAE
jgi:hypothetical protein